MNSQGVTFDTGMLVALERRKQRAWAIYRRAQERSARDLPVADADLPIGHDRTIEGDGDAPDQHRDDRRRDHHERGAHDAHQGLLPRRQHQRRTVVNLARDFTREWRPTVSEVDPRADERLFRSTEPGRVRSIRARL